MKFYFTGFDTGFLLVGRGRGGGGGGILSDSRQDFGTRHWDLYIDTFFEYLQLCLCFGWHNYESESKFTNIPCNPDL